MKIFGKMPFSLSLSLIRQRFPKLKNICIVEFKQRDLQREVRRYCNENFCNNFVHLAVRTNVRMDSERSDESASNYLHAPITFMIAFTYYSGIDFE